MAALAHHRALHIADRAAWRRSMLAILLVITGLIATSYTLQRHQQLGVEVQR